MATITLTIDCVLVEDGSVTLSATITDADGIPPELFLYKLGKTQNLDSYSGVASPWEIVTYPGARDVSKPYYRLSTATIPSLDLTSASVTKTSLGGFLQETVTAYASFSGVVGEEETVIESEE